MALQSSSLSALSYAQQTPSSDSSDDASLLTALTEITTRLSSALSNAVYAERAASDALVIARDALPAESCSVWLRTPDRITQSWCVGNETLSINDIEGILLHRRSSSPTLRVVEMRFGSRNVGALSVKFPEIPSAAQLAFINTLANILASCIAIAEQSRRLQGDLHVRMRENEEQRRFTEMIVDLLPLGLYVIDRDYRITVWNHKRETGMQGVSREEAIGRTIFEVLHRQPAEVLRREFDEIFATGRMQQFHSESTSSGKVRTYRLSKIPMRDDSQRVTHIITIGEDITDWVEARERVSQTEKLAAVGRLAAGIMHEINNPLATIAACAESMGLENTVTTDSPEYVKIIESEVARCKHIIDGLLDFSRPKPLQREPISVNSVVERTLFLLNHHARFKQLTVNLELSESLPRVHASMEQLLQVMIALLMNAADAMPHFGQVTIRSQGADGPTPAVVIEVEDQGTGIPRAQMARIFEPFYTTKAPGQGTGLGLAICYGIVAEHGGRMEVDSEVSKGSVFRIILPVEMP